MQKKIEKVTSAGEKILLSLFRVDSVDRISKREMEVFIIKQNDVIKDLMGYLFHENSNHPFIQQLDEQAINKLRSDKFKNGRKTSPPV